MSINLSPRTTNERLTPATISSSPDEHTNIEQSMIHNVPSPYDHEARQTPAPQYMSSEQGTAYSSPGSSHWTQDTFANEQHPGTYSYAYPNPEFAGDVSRQNPPYATSARINLEQSPYHTYSRGTPASERSDLSVGNSRYQERPQHARPQSKNKPKPKKKKKGNENDRSDLLPDDVHILSRDSDAPTQDIERFVNRATEVRHKEVEGKNGYRPRPMNNFMLYRKAYQERAKEVSSQSNHQIVSQVVALSWKSEAPEVRERFAEYAQTEKENHILAFPDYQFRPNKSQKAKKRKTGLDTDDDNWTDFGDDMNDPDWGRSSKRPRTRQNRALMYENDYGYQEYGQPAYTLPYHSDPRSTFGAPNQARPPPMAVHEPAQDIYSEQIVSQAYSDPLHFDDAHWESLAIAEGDGVPMASHVSGLPGAGNALLNPPDDFGPPAQYGSSHLGQLDPLLVTEDHGANGAFTQSEFENLNSMGLEVGWDEHRASSSGGMLPVANHDDGAAYDDEQFAHFLRS